MPSRKDWIAELYQALVSGRGDAAVASRDLPALGQLTITRPELLKPFTEHNRRHPDQAVRPGAFVSVCYPKPFACVQPIRLFAPFTTPERALDQAWYELRTGDQVRITTEDPLGEIVPGVIPVKSYRDIATAYFNRPEVKFASGCGPCLPDSAGALRRRHVHARGVEHLGKEANLLRRRPEGGDARNESQQIYVNHRLTDPEMELLAALPRQQTAASAGISERALQNILSRRATPRPALAEALRSSLRKQARWFMRG